MLRLQVILLAVALSILLGPTATEAATEELKTLCERPENAVADWTYNKENTKNNCTNTKDKRGLWTMLNAYRSGGMKQRHWKYIEKDNYSGCLKDWTYYSKDGKTVIASIRGYATTLGDKYNKLWCALPTYQPDGKRGFQWEYCLCRGFNTTD